MHGSARICTETILAARGGMSKRIRAAYFAVALAMGAVASPKADSPHTYLVCTVNDGFELWIVIESLGSVGAARQHCVRDWFGFPDRLEP